MGSFIRPKNCWGRSSDDGEAGHSARTKYKQQNVRNAEGAKCKDRSPNDFGFYCPGVTCFGLDSYVRVVKVVGAKSVNYVPLD